MCSDPSSTPPIEPAPGGAASGRAIGLLASDGHRVAAFEAHAPTSGGAGIVVLPDYFGLTGFYQELALRFAEIGVDAVAIDYYGRTADPPPRDESFDHRRHAQLTTWAGLQADIHAAAAHLRLHRGVKTLFSIGFCFGGRISFLSGTLPELSLAGVIGFYGWPVGPYLNDTPAPADVATRLHSPLLGLFGGADDKIPLHDVQAFQRALSGAPVEHDIRLYEDAPHSFFDRRREQSAEASADAWSAVRSFIRAHPAGSPASAAGG